MTLSRTHYQKRLKTLLAQYPIVAVLGPRQCGKTTLCQRDFKNFDYLDLELPSDLAKLSGDAELFLTHQKKPLVIDEAQRLPQLFPILRSLTDQHRSKRGRFLLLGSLSFQLVSQINESLSGRVAFLDLTPFLYPEVFDDVSLKTHWLKGGFPEALLPVKKKQLNFSWFEHYTRTLIERDLPALGIEIGPSKFRQLWQMCVHFHGNLLNMNKIATSMGISAHTVERYLNILEQTFMIRRLRPFSTNLKKRLVKAPKLYFRDSGVFHYFARLLTEEALFTSPERGASFEGYVIEQLMSLIRLKKPEWEFYFFRTADEIEVDLLLVKNKQIIPIEIKTTLAPTLEHAQSLIKAQSLLKTQKGIVFHLGKDTYPLTATIECISFEKWVEAGCPMRFLEEKK